MPNPNTILLLLLLVCLGMAVRIDWTYWDSKHHSGCGCVERPEERKYYEDEGCTKKDAGGLERLEGYTCTKDALVEKKWKQAFVNGKLRVKGLMYKVYS